MLYHLLAPLGREHIVFNVFRYLTFRSAMAFISAFVLSLVLGPWLIARLREWQKDGATLREDTPDRHRAKAGTSIGVTVGNVEEGALRMTVRTVGIVQTNETKLAHVHLRTEGWVEQVFVDFTGDG